MAESLQAIRLAAVVLSSVEAWLYGNQFVIAMMEPLEEGRMNRLWWLSGMMWGVLIMGFLRKISP